MAAGKGVRMHSERAKVLHEILGVPMVYYVIEGLRNFGVEETYVVVGHQADKVRAACGDGVKFIEQPQHNGTGDALARCKGALSNFKGAILVIGGDTMLITRASLQALCDEHTNTKADCTVLTACLDDPSGYGRVLRSKTGGVEKIIEDADATPKEKMISEVNSGVYLFAPPIFDVLSQIKPNNKKGEYYLTTAIELLLSQGKKVACVRAQTQTEIYGINTQKDLIAVTNYLRWKILDEKMEQGVRIVDPSTTYIETGVQIGADTVILPFSVIRRGAVIGSHCEIGPFAHIRTGTVLEDHAEIGNFVETKKTKVGSHSKAKHLSYLGDAIIGANVNIGAGTITANYDGKNKNTTIIEDGAFTGCNTVLVAPVKMGKGSKTGAGAIVPKGKDIPAGDVVAGVPARSLKNNLKSKKKVIE